MTIFAEMWEWFGDLSFLGRIGVYIVLGNIMYLIIDFKDGKFRSDGPETSGPPTARTPSERNRPAPKRNAVHKLATSPPNESVRLEALKLRDLLLLYNHEEVARRLERHAAELGDPNSAEQALRSLDSMCHPKWLGDINLPGYDTGPGWYGWLQPLEEALAAALRRYR
jgi:hypothetical protein